MRAAAIAPSNLALVKYWGKRDSALNVPATGSISVTLDGLSTSTTVDFREDLEADECVLDGVRNGRGAERVTRFLETVRSSFGVERRALVESASDFPAAAGLASSASGFAALALACDAALGLSLSEAQLSALARRGSGSAARSIVGGFAEMRPGEAADGSDAFAVQIAPPERLPLAILAAVTTRARKPVGSTEGMLRTAESSPFYGAWTSSVPRALAEMRAALEAADLERVGMLAEANAMRMHATMLGADPPLLYWNGVTVELVHAVRELRAAGVQAYVTIDAGPQVKVLCEESARAAVREALLAVEGTLEVLEARPGEGARLQDVQG